MGVRERLGGDLPACVDALRETYEADRYPKRWPADPAAWLSPDALIRAWVSEIDGRVVGHVGVRAGVGEPGFAAAAGLPVDEVALVTRLFVAPTGRGLGLARDLLATLLQHTEGEVGLDVTEGSSPAIALYESLGWRYVGRERASWQMQDGTHPIVRYYLAPR